MLKHQAGRQSEAHTIQPPSGGCVLKLMAEGRSTRIYPPAAFGRLCVETALRNAVSKAAGQPPSGGCVLKPLQLAILPTNWAQPPSGGCVLKLLSPLRLKTWKNQPPSGGCVLKRVR